MRNKYHFLDFFNAFRVVEYVPRTQLFGLTDRFYVAPVSGESGVELHNLK